MTAESESWTTAKLWVFLGNYNDANALFTLRPQRKT